MIAPFVSVSGLAQSFAEWTGVHWSVLILGLSLPFVGMFGALMLFAFYPDRTHAVATFMARPLPERLRTLLDSLIAMLLHGLAPLRRPGTLAALFALSIPIWLAEAAVFWIVGFPFGIQDAHDGPAQMAVTMVLVTSVTNIGGSVPAAPGGLGLFEIIARETLVFSTPATLDRQSRRRSRLWYTPRSCCL